MDEEMKDEQIETEDLEQEEKYDKEEIKSAKELIQHLSKTSKTLKIYLSNNPIHQKFITELLDKLQSHLSTFGPLHLRVKQFELHCSGQPVYENINRMESIAFRLFIDGLRELSFHPGIDKEELITFLEVLGKEGEGNGVDDDIVTLLWEKHFSHIQYIVVSDLQGEFRKMEDCPEMKTIDPTPQQLKEVYSQTVEAPAAGSLVLSSPKGIDVPDLNIFKLTEEEIRKIKGEVRAEEELDVVGELEGILFDILRIEREPVLFSEILGIIDNILENLMLKGDFVHARKILEFFWEMLDPAKNLPPVLSTQIQNALGHAGNPKRMMTLAPVLNGEMPQQLEDLFSFMILFEKNAILPIIELLGAVEKMKPRHVLCDALVELGKMDIETIISKLEDSRWYLVRNLIYVLGKIGDVRVIESFSRFIRHKELKVRKEVLHALDTMEDPRACQLLVHFIPDPDPSNRIFAIKSLSKKKVKEGLKALLNVLSSKDFQLKELYEKKEIFDAIAKIGGDEVVPEMRKFFKKKWSLFKNTQLEEMGLCAAVALQRIGSPTAIEALLEGSKSNNKTIRGACNKALDVLNTVRH
jgi:HEAT repeat protein